MPSLIWFGIHAVMCAATQLDHDESDHSLLAELGPNFYYKLPLTAEAEMVSELPPAAGTRGASGFGSTVQCIDI